MEDKFCRRVAVIGAGPAGLAAARHFTAPGSPFECKVFEQGSDLGGTWVLTRHVDLDDIGRPVHSSMYENLRTNLPKEVMCYPDYPFPDYEKSYLTSEQVLKYLHDYADHFHLRQHIQFNKWVKEVSLIGPDEEWQLTVFDWLTNETNTEIFDAVIVCNGHFSCPNVPTIPGSDIFQGTIIHSRQYRERSSYTDKRVLVVGGSFSAVDIVMELANVVKYVYLSHHVKDMASNFPENVKMAPDLDYFFQSGACFKNGQKEEFDNVILSTGYKHDYPFLHKSCQITTDGYGVEPLHKHLINIEHPSMCFLAINNYISPLQLADVQTRYFYQLLKGSFQLPGKSEMYNLLKADQKYRQEELGFPARLAHKLGPLQREYYDDLADTAGVKRIWPVVTKLHTESSRSKFKDLYTFRDKVFKVIDEENFEEIK